MKLYTQRSKTLFTQASEDSAAPLAEINTTPLIDVMLVLLVMLIITIPMQLHSLALDLPSSSSVQPPAHVRLQIDAQGFVRWNDQLMTHTQALDLQLAQAAAQAPQPEIHIQPNPDTAYTLVLRLIAQVQKAGLQRVGVVQ